MKYKIRFVIIVGIVFAIGLVFFISRSSYMLIANKNNYSALLDDTIKNSLNNSNWPLQNLNSENILILYDSRKRDSRDLKNNISRTLKYIKYPFDITDIKSPNLTLSKYSTIVTAFSDFNKLDNIESLVNFVNEGGKIFVACGIEVNDGFFRMFRKIGIEDYGNGNTFDTFKFHSNILIGCEGNTFKCPDTMNFGIPVRLSKDSLVLAVMGNNIPLIWETNYGKGKFVVFNGNILHLKSARGLIVGMLGRLIDDFIYPILNMKIFYIDDFAAPAPNSVNTNITSEYNRSISGFYRDIWWPKIMQDAKKYKIKYSAALIYSYEDTNNIALKIEQYEKSDIITYGRELLKTDGEIGYHGFNHQPLILKSYKKPDLGYKIWKDENSIIYALQTLDNIFKSVFPNYKITGYVPPSNILSEDGRYALLKAIPSIKLIASIYNTDDISEVEALEQEFEVAIDGIVELPRLTYGYHFDSHIKWNLVNGISSLGVVSHFIHPDDVLDPVRNHNKNWVSLSKEYEKLLSTLHEDYQWLESLTMSEAAAKTQNFEWLDVKYKKSSNIITGYCKNQSSKVDFILRTQKKATAQTNCSIKEIDHNVYLVSTDKDIFTVKLEVKK